MLARVVLAIVLVLVPSAASADVCCDDATALIDEGIFEPPPIDLPIATPRRVVAEQRLDEPYVSPALARVFRPPR